MLIIAGKLYVAKADRDRFVEGHRDVVAKSREADGCLDVAISPDLIEDNRVNMFELWDWVGGERGLSQFEALRI